MLRKGAGSKMTCRQADQLMEEVLDGDLDGDSHEDLREHLSHCERCAEDWDAAWQVRSLLRGRESVDPGEAYFEQATANIMDRIAVLAVRTRPVEEVPVASSARYGPLSIRGVGLAFLLLLTLCLDALHESYGAVRSFSPLGPKQDLRLAPIDPSVDLAASFHACLPASPGRAVAGQGTHAAIHRAAPSPAMGLPATDGDAAPRTPTLSTPHPLAAML